MLHQKHFIGARQANLLNDPVVGLFAFKIEGRPVSRRRHQRNIPTNERTINLRSLPLTRFLEHVHEDASEGQANVEARRKEIAQQRGSVRAVIGVTLLGL